MMDRKAVVTVAVPSFNQGQFLEKALDSIFQQNLPAEVYVVDGGSTDNSIDVIRQWEPRLAGWRSHKDQGQAAAINEALAQGTAPYVCWLNSDDWFLPGGLSTLVDAIVAHPEAPMVYGRAMNVVDGSSRTYPVWVEPFSERRMALRCIISQPATLFRRSVWSAVGGVDVNLHMAMDYDLWWRIYKSYGAPHFLNDCVAVNRIHADTKTNTQRARHYSEAMSVVRRHYGSLPLKWWITQPYSVWFKSMRPY